MRRPRLAGSFLQCAQPISISSCSSPRGFARINSGDLHGILPVQMGWSDIRIFFLTHAESVNGTLVSIKIGPIYDFVNIVSRFFFIVCPTLEFFNEVYCSPRGQSLSASGQEETYHELEKGSPATPVAASGSSGVVKDIRRRWGRILFARGSRKPS
jgi:hypothetical protein